MNAKVLPQTGEATTPGESEAALLRRPRDDRSPRGRVARERVRDAFSPVFVVGHPRSGTTLLAAILGRHSEFAATPETQYLTYARYPIERQLGKGAEAVIEAYGRTRLASLGVDGTQLHRRLSGGQALTLDLVFRKTLELYAEKHAKRTVVEKTPTHIRYVDLLHRWYPQAKFVWIVRDGRACVASLRKLDWASDNLYGLSWQWVRNIAYGLRAESLWGHAMKRVRYEDLVTEPERVTREIDEWLGVDFERNQLDPSVRTEVVTNFEQSWKSKVSEPISPARAQAWREDLQPHEFALLSGLMGRSLGRLGYSSAGDGVKTQFPERALGYGMMLSCNPILLSVQSAVETAAKRIGAVATG